CKLNKTAIGAKGLPCHPLRFLARKKEDDSCNVFGFPETAECVHLGKPLNLFRRFADRKELGIDRTGRYGINCDISLPKLFCQLPCELFDGSFGASIQTIGWEHLARHRSGEVDDAAI